MSRYLRFGTYVFLLLAVLVAKRDRQFIEFLNFPFVDRSFNSGFSEPPVDMWLSAFEQRTGGLTEPLARYLARQALLSEGVAVAELMESHVTLRRSKEAGSYVVTYPRTLRVGTRQVLCAVVTEDRKVSLHYDL